MTPKQKNVFDYIEGYFTAHDVSPTFQEIQSALGLKSRSSVHKYVEELQKQGHIYRDKHHKRSIRIVSREATINRYRNALRKISRTCNGYAVEIADEALK